MRYVFILSAGISAMTDNASGRIVHFATEGLDDLHFLGPRAVERFDALMTFLGDAICFGDPRKSRQDNEKCGPGYDLDDQGLVLIRQSE